MNIIHNKLTELFIANGQLSSKTVSLWSQILPFTENSGKCKTWQTDKFISGNVFADKCNMQLLSLQWSIETFSTTRKAILRRFSGRRVLILTVLSILRSTQQSKQKGETSGSVLLEDALTSRLSDILSFCLHSLGSFDLHYTQHFYTVIVPTQKFMDL